MDKERFVQNVKKLCLMKNIKPTNACKESGVGSSFLSDIQRGQTPSVAKVQLLAQYLGVTTSDLLGEAQKSSPPSEEDRLLAGLTRSARGIGKSWRNIWTCCYRLKIGHETPTVFRRKPPVFLDEALV